MKELKDYLFSLIYVALAGLVGTIMVALGTAYFALCWWVIRHIWDWFAKI